MRGLGTWRGRYPEGQVPRGGNLPPHRAGGGPTGLSHHHLVAPSPGFNQGHLHHHRSKGHLHPHHRGVIHHPRVRVRVVVPRHRHLSQSRMRNPVKGPIRQASANPRMWVTNEYETSPQKSVTTHPTSEWLSPKGKKEGQTAVHHRPVGRVSRQNVTIVPQLPRSKGGI